MLQTSKRNIILVAKTTAKSVGHHIFNPMARMAAKRSTGQCVALPKYHYPQNKINIRKTLDVNRQIFSHSSAVSHGRCVSQWACTALHPALSSHPTAPIYIFCFLLPSFFLPQRPILLHYAHNQGPARRCWRHPQPRFSEEMLEAPPLSCAGVRGWIFKVSATW